MRMNNYHDMQMATLSWGLFFVLLITTNDGRGWLHCMCMTPSVFLFFSVQILITKNSFYTVIVMLESTCFFDFLALSVNKYADHHSHEVAY